MSPELSPDRELARELYRHKIMSYIARTLLAPTIENPMPNIGYDESEVVS